MQLDKLKNRNMRPYSSENYYRLKIPGWMIAEDECYHDQLEVYNQDALSALHLLSQTNKNTQQP